MDVEAFENRKNPKIPILAPAEPNVTGPDQAARRQKNRTGQRPKIRSFDKNLSIISNQPSLVSNL